MNTGTNWTQRYLHILSTCSPMATLVCIESETKARRDLQVTLVLRQGSHPRRGLVVRGVPGWEDRVWGHGESLTSKPEPMGVKARERVDAPERQSVSSTCSRAGCPSWNGAISRVTRRPKGAGARQGARHSLPEKAPLLASKHQIKDQPRQRRFYTQRCTKIKTLEAIILVRSHFPSHKLKVFINKLQA